MAELAQLRWSGYVVRMGDERYNKMAWQFRTHGKRPKRSLRLTWEQGMHKIRKGKRIEWKGVISYGSRLWETESSVCTIYFCG